MARAPASVIIRCASQAPSRSRLLTSNIRPHLNPLFASSWYRLWAGLGASGDGSAHRTDLLARYSEPWREYHTLQHLAECLSLFDTASHLAARPSEVEAALWFHDAIYELRASDNEERSAHLAQSVLASGGVSPEVASRVLALVLATKHHAAPSQPDAQLLVDVDLSILASSPARFAEYEQQIREEYSFVSEATFRQKRREVLSSFLERPRIFSTEHFFARLENQARANIRRATGESAA